ncbi:hypothetical protein BACUNI_00604 [Bacteroides uniformis ATCC 8492]|uniref:Uncharacterized protein n=1 Tax=Bacteroides uniformis (strain ATCC 8492 / DSM 6597 / CCUG 4942 / CIP 103695 / JCM 5828 / KCTC 5204 / NCTC 13054 / VPI 0061) TaxID=411479 RepID=A0ABC9NG96_BACUC|nr:hypothetical protein BACUNI_00604 [Bacteroides uniformis ATCC 8492]
MQYLVLQNVRFLKSHTYSKCLRIEGYAKLAKVLDSYMNRIEIK